MAEIAKSLDLLRNTLEKLDIDLSDESIEKIKDNGLTDIQDSFKELLVNNKLSAVKALNLGKVMNSVEHALTKSADGLENTLSKKPQDDKLFKEALLDNAFEIAEIIDNAALFSVGKFEAFTQTIANKIDGIDNEDELNTIIDFFENQERRDLSQSDIDKVKERNEIHNREKLIGLAEMLVSLNKDELDESLKQSKKLNNIFLATLVKGKDSLSPIKSLAATGAIGGLLKGVVKKLGPIGLLVATMDDVFKTINDPQLANNSVTSSAITGAITGGPDATYTGNAAKYAIAGAMLGSVIPVIGTAIGGAIGAVTGLVVTYFTKGKIKKIADMLDNVGATIFNPATWIGEDGIFGKLYKIPDYLDEKIKGAWNSFKSNFTEGSNFQNVIQDILTVKDDILNFISKPFTKEFWTETFETVGDFGTDMKNSILEKWGKAKSSIVDFLSKPFTKEFWVNMFDEIGGFKKLLMNTFFNDKSERVVGSNPRSGKAKLTPRELIPIEKKSAQLRKIADKKEIEIEKSKQKVDKTENNTALVNQTLNSGNTSNIQISRGNRDLRNPASRFLNGSFGY